MIWIDALRVDYIDKHPCPVLRMLVGEHGFGRLRHEIGFSSIGASVFTGTRASKHQQLAMFGRISHPQRLGLGRLLPGELRNWYFNVARYLRGNHNVVRPPPAQVLRYIGILQDRYYHQPNSLPVPTIFDILREHEVKFLLYNHPILATNEDTRLIPDPRLEDRLLVDRFLRYAENEIDIGFIHLWALDREGHREGPDAPEMATVLREEDRLVGRLLKEVPGVKNFLLWSDHGMVPVVGTIDLREILGSLRDDFKYFLDSTMARIWFEDGRKKATIRRNLETLKGGRFITDEEKLRMGITPNRDVSGDLLFLADPGFVIFPNFFNRTLPAGMHGYDHSDERENTGFISNWIPVSEMEGIDIGPSLLGLLGIKPPGWMDGSDRGGKSK